MKIYLLNEMIKNRAHEGTLTYSHIVSKFLCPKSLNLFISKILSTRLTPEHHRHYIILIPHYHLDKLWFRFYEGVIIKLLFFFSERGTHICAHA